MSDQASWAILGPPVRGRSCGTCTSCCTLVPVELGDEDKPSNVRCKHVCSRGCGIYAARPDPCRYWSCRWLFDDATAELRRPDKSGYIIDSMLDTIGVDGRAREVIQIWVDPARPDAHHDPALRRYLAAMAERYGLAAIVRWEYPRAMVLAAPCLTGGDWVERESEMVTREAVANTIAATSNFKPTRSRATLPGN